MNMIFHHPLPITPNAKSASGIRPLRMIEAFRELGYSVDLVVGYSGDRKRAIREIKENIRNGKQYDFVYSESSTMPTVLTDRHHLPLNPLLDLLFFRFLNKKNIPIGLFYRDIYWLFDDYGKKLSRLKVLVAKVAYYYDLWVYEKTLTKLFLPSVEMGDYIPVVNVNKFRALPPGHKSPENTESHFDQHHVNLFYVGGIGAGYKLHLLVDVLADYPKIKLTICTRETEWDSEKNNYPILSDNITVIHEVGERMESALCGADIAVAFLKPNEYRKFSAPVKIYEYLGFHKPILASSGTLAGSFVESHQIGWALEYTSEGVRTFFDSLLNKTETFFHIKQNMAKIAKEHTWKARAQQVRNDLAL